MMSSHPNSSNSYNSDQSTSRVTPSSSSSAPTPYSNTPHSFGSSSGGHAGSSGGGDTHVSPHHQPHMDIKQERSPPDVSGLTMKNVSTSMTDPEIMEYLIKL